MKSSTRFVLAHVVAAVLIAWPGASPQAEPPEATAEATAEATVPAIWLEREASFVYMGQTTYYSCEGLRDKLRYILTRIGARRDDLNVTVSCFNAGSGVELMPHVRLKAFLPVEATPELLAELRDDPRRELVARVRGEGGVDLEAAQFPAVRKLFELGGARDRRIEEGDCELLEILVRQVFPKLGVRVAEGTRLSCVPHARPIGSVVLRLESLHAAPRPDDAAEPGET